MLYLKGDKRIFRCDGCGREVECSRAECKRIPKGWFDGYSSFSLQEECYPKVREQFEVYGIFCTTQCLSQTVSEALNRVLGQKGCDES